MKVKIQELNKPNKNGRIYTTEVMEKAIKNFKPDTLGTLEMPKDIFGETDVSYGIQLSQVSHVVKDLKIEDGYLVGEIKILATPMGKILENMLTNPESMMFRTVGTGKVDKGGLISDFSIISVAAIPAETAA